MKLAFVGLGQMGRHMAANLANSDDDLLAVDRTPTGFLILKREAPRPVPLLTARLTQTSSFSLSAKSGSSYRRAACRQWHRRELKPGQLVVDTSTITLRPRARACRSARGPRHRIPRCSGLRHGGAGARRHAHHHVRWRARGVRSVRPYLACIASKILYMGPAGSGQLTKLINQLLFDINAAALAEILPMSVKLGLDPAQVGEVVNSGTGRSYASEFFIPRILEDNFSEGYSMANAYKDLVSAAEIGAQRCIPMPVLNGRDRDLPDGAAAGPRQQGQGGHDPCVRGSPWR